jgi:glycosyltransferase involved in cell wall biosynthesis
MPGGVEKLTCYLSSALVERGHEVTVLYRDAEEGAPYFPIDKRVRQINILFEQGKKVVSEKLPLYLRAYRETCRLFSQSKAQGINARFKGAQYGPRIKKFMAEYPADVIISCSAPSTKYVITDAECHVPVITLFRGDPVIQMPLLSPEEREAVEQSAAIQVLWPSKVAVSQKFFPHVPAIPIGNAVLPAEKMAHPGDKKERYLICCVGNVSGRKNQKLLARAFMRLAEAFPDWDLEFWGAKTSHYAKALEDFIRHEHMENRIFLKGKTNHIGDVYERADIFCISSKSEGFPQGLAEAMSAGIPAVGLKICGGTNELIQDGKTGFLVGDDPELLADALKKLMQDPDLRQRMGQAGWESVQPYAPEKMWDIWENLLIRAAGK